MLRDRILALLCIALLRMRMGQYVLNRDGGMM
jgi:hypothetical protein